MDGFKFPYSNDDLEIGCMYGNYVERDVIFVEYGQANPLDLIKTLQDVNFEKFQRLGSGFGADLDKNQLAKKLSQINTGDDKSYWLDIINYYEMNELRPVIVINGKLCDGAHRSLLMYAKGLKIPTALFKTSYQEDPEN